MNINNEKAYLARQAATKYRPFEGAATFYRFLHAKMFVYILKQFATFTKSRLVFIIHVTLCFHGLCRLRTMNVRRPRKKPHQRVEKLHISKAFFTTLRCPGELQETETPTQLEKLFSCFLCKKLRQAHFITKSKYKN